MKSIGLLSLLAVTSAVCAISIGCGSKDSSTPAASPSAQPMAYNGQPGAYPQQGYPQQGYPQQGYTAQPNGYPAQPNGYPAQPGQPTQPGATPSATTTAPGFPGLPGFPAQPSSGGGGASGGTAQALDPSSAAVASGALALYANSAAPGMQKEGTGIAGNFTPGQTLESTFTFTPGKCYTLLAAGVGVTDVGLEMQYVTPLPGLNPSIGTNQSRGAQVAMGAGANCLKPMSPFPANAKFIVKANAGSGIIAAQLYSK